MNKLFLVLAAAAFVTSPTVAMAADDKGAMPPAAGTPGMMNKDTMNKDTMNKDMMNKNGMAHKNGMNMKGMDANNDGMLSKQEFMSHHEKMYDSMKKNKDGTVDMKEMGMGMGGEKGMMSEPKK